MDYGAAKTLANGSRCKMQNTVNVLPTPSDTVVNIGTER